MSDIQKLTKQVVKFRDERNWKQFHNPKDLALSLLLEAGEVLEHFQWLNKKEIDKYVKNSKADISDEIADVLKYLLLFCDSLNIDLAKAVQKKIVKDDAKYPIAKSYGKHTKYNKL